MSEDLHTYFNDRIEATVGALVYGRKTFEMMAGYWPNALEDDDPNTARFARLWVPTPKLVVSNTLTDPGWSATIVRGDVADELARHRGETDGDLILIGSGEIATQLLLAGAIDEHHVFTQPVLLGGGRRLYPDGAERTRLALVEARTFSNGVVLQRHVRASA